MLRGFVAVALIIAAMVAIKDGRALEETGILSSCKAVATPHRQSGRWTACRPGKLEGRPNLTRRSCVSQGVVETVEYWRCPEQIETGPGG